MNLEIFQSLLGFTVFTSLMFILLLILVFTSNIKMLFKYILISLFLTFSVYSFNFMKDYLGRPLNSNLPNGLFYIYKYVVSENYITLWVLNTENKKSRLYKIKRLKDVENQLEEIKEGREQGEDFLVLVENNSFERKLLNVRELIGPKE